MDNMSSSDPETDREWIMLISKDVKNVDKCLNAPDGICYRVTKLEQYLPKIYYVMIILALLEVGRYVFGPDKIPAYLCYLRAIMPL